MELFSKIWGSVSYVGALYFAVFLAAHKLEKKSGWLLKICLSFLFVSLIGHEYNQYFLMQGNSLMTVFFRSLICFVFFAASVITMLICCKCSLWEALFCSSAGYAMEHITQRLSVLVTSVFFPAASQFFETVILLLITIGIYAFVFYRIISNSHYNRIIVNHKQQIMVSIAILFSTIILNSTAGYLAEQQSSQLLYYQVNFYSILTAAFALFIEFSLLFQKNAEIERDILQQLMHESENQFRIEKSAIDMINVKCHDMKHRLTLIQRKVAPDEVEEIQHAINSYDFIFHTGNPALDTVLTMKSLQCERQNIVMTCLGNGESLSFLSDSDVYALFGNILDNAIEAVMQLQEPDWKIIGLTISCHSDFVFIHEENYCQGEITYRDGLPQTGKTDKNYHGFGTHSIKLITEKYHGSCRFADENHIFTVDIAFPINL